MKVNVTTRHINNTMNSEKIKSYALKKTKRIERYVKSERDPSELRFIYHQRNSGILLRSL